MLFAVPGAAVLVDQAGEVGLAVEADEEVVPDAGAVGDALAGVREEGAKGGEIGRGVAEADDDEVACLGHGDEGLGGVAVALEHLHAEGVGARGLDAKEAEVGLCAGAQVLQRGQVAEALRGAGVGALRFCIAGGDHIAVGAVLRRVQRRGADFHRR